MLLAHLACVDADVIVPGKFFPKEEWAARTLRPKLLRLLPTYLQPVIDLEPKHKLRIPPCDAGDTDNPLSYLITLEIDRSVGPMVVTMGSCFVDTAILI